METLPSEVVEVLSRYLAARDLARCCAVSPRWRDIFDQDWLWKSRCTPALEEPLRTTPSVVEPVFVSPEVGNSTMPPISKWRLAYIREVHLWSNWQKKNNRTHTTVTLYSPGGNIPSTKHPFLSDTLIVNWYLTCIEIWDISVIPATMVAVSESSVNFPYVDTHCGVLGNNMLFVENQTYIKVFVVDYVKKSIKLKHEISLENGREFRGGSGPIFVDGSILLLRSTRETLIIFDLGKGEKVIEEPCPLVEYKVGNLIMTGIDTSRTSDDVLVTTSDDKHRYYYIFSLKQQVFLPGPIATSNPQIGFRSVINKHYVAINILSFLNIIDYHSSEVLFKNEGQTYCVQAYNDGFIFGDLRNGKCQFNKFSLKTKTLTTFFEYQSNEYFPFCIKIVNDRLVTVFEYWEPIAKFDISRQIPEKIDIGLNIPYYLWERVNSSFTRGSSTSNEKLTFYYYW